MNEQTIYQSSERDIYNVNSLNMYVSNIGEQVSKGLFPNNATVNIQYQSRPLNTTIPPHSSKKAHRMQTVKSFIDTLTTIPGCYIHGGIGVGKTQLALLIAESSSRTTYWFRLREYNNDVQLVDNILQSILNLANIQSYLFQNNCFETALRQLSGSLLVFDDLMRFQSNSQIAELISTICSIAPKYNLNMIITSNFELPFRLKEELSSQMHVTQAPPFTDTEIVELFKEYGAPDIFLSQFMNLIIATTNRHPMLIMAMISYLNQLNWQINYNNAPDLLTRQYATDVKLEIQDLVTKTALGKDKELLYRLSIFSNSFNDQDVIELSNVEPIISYPLESINNLIGLWLQRDSVNTYLVSPLIGDLGKKNLAPNILKQIHNTIACSILKKKLLSSSDGLYVIVHFLSAEQHRDAAFILLSMLNSFVASKNIAKDDWGVTSIWYDVALPIDLQYEIKILLRLAQIEACKKIGKDYSYLLNDLKQLSTLLKPTDGFIGSLSLIAVAKLCRIDFDLSISFMQIAIQCKDIDIEKSLPDGITWESLIWTVTSHINTSTRLYTWLQTFNMLSEEQVRTSEKSPIFKYAFTFVSENIWLAEHDKPENNQNWDQVLAALSELEKIAKSKNSLLVWASAIRAQSIVLAEYKKDVKNAVRIAEEALTRNPENKSVTFLLSEVIGREYTIAKQYEKALPWWKIIYDIEIEDFVSERIDSFILASEAIGAFNTQEAVQYTAKSVTLAFDNKNLISKSRLSKTLAEHTIAVWIASGVKEAFKTYELAIDHLFLSKDDSNTWKSLFVLLGHVSGYLLAIAQQGAPPELNTKGEVNVPPKRGLFRGFNLEASQSYNAANDCGLCTQVSMFAESINNFEAAERWAIKAYDMGYGKSPNTFLLIKSIPALIKTDRIIEAIRLSEEIFSFASAAMSTPNATEKIDVQQVLGNKPNENWNLVESQIAFRVVLPSFIKIITLRLLGLDSFEDKTSRFIEELNRIKVNASNPFFWDSAIQIVVSFKTDSHLNDVFTTCEGDHYKTTLQAMSYLVFALKGTPQRVSKYLLAALPSIYEQLTGTDRLLIPLFADFMRSLGKRVVSEKKFFFSNPDSIEKELSTVLLLPDQSVTSNMLVILSLGLNVSIPENAKTFIKNNDGCI